MKEKIIHVLCEGQTEQSFVEAVLKPYLVGCGVKAVKSVIVTTKKNFRGGIVSYSQVKKDLLLMRSGFHDGQYERHLFTTMIDFYALPEDFPGYEEARKIVDKYERISSLESAFADDVGMRMRGCFVPYFQLHEFEALVFCGIEYLLRVYPGRERQCERLNADLDRIGNPEMINDSPDSAPSKRIIRAIEEVGGVRNYRYNKVSAGRDVTLHVGVENLRARCPHFDAWVQRLLDT